MSFIRPLIVVTAMLFGPVSAHAQAVSGQGTWESTLLGRDINRNSVSASDVSAVYLYDTTLNVTWLRNNYYSTWDWQSAKTSIEWQVTGSGANAISDWRLPKMIVDPNISYGYSYNGSTPMGYNVSSGSSELASLFYKTLGNKAVLNTNGDVQLGYGLTNKGNFQNLYATSYWMNDQNRVNSGYIWYFNTASGNQNIYDFGQVGYTLAVRDGDVLAAVPEPETYAMLIAGLGIIGALSRRRITKPITKLGFPLS